LTVEEIMALKPGKELDAQVTSEAGFSPSTDMNDAWKLRIKFWEDFGGDIQNNRFCEGYPENCEWLGDRKRVSVWAETGAEAITKLVALVLHGHFGDFHPLHVFPELLEAHNATLNRLAKSLNIKGWLG